MTALAGVWRLDGRPDAEDACERVLTAQQIYGRDDVSHWSAGSVALGRRLHQILPEDRFDSQPLVGGGGRYVLVADIRLDNRDALAKELRLAEPHALCDAAILLAAIERWQENCVERLVGDFAFAYWDAKQQRMVLARDALGEQPLHYHRSEKLFAFASMPKGLHALPEIPYAPDEERIAEKLLLLDDSGTHSFFKGIERVPQGHILTVGAESFVLRRHWQPKRDSIRLSSPEAYGEALRAHLDEAVRCRLRGADDLGVYLSGGLDSGAVAATAARLLAPSGGRFFAFTATPRNGYSGPVPAGSINDEGPYAAATAALYPNIDHVLVPNEGCDPVSFLDNNFYLYDRPSNGFSNAGWSRSLQMALAKRRIRVTLGGDAGNCGLSYDGIELLPELFSSGRWAHLHREAHALVANGWMGFRGVLRQTLGPWCPAPLWIWLHRRVGRDVYELRDYSAINLQRMASLDPNRLRGHDFVNRPWKDGFEARLSALLENDPGNFRKGILAGYQIDQRDPTADVRLLDFCFGVPTDQFLRDGVPRALVLRALADRLPKLVLEERRRARQNADWHEDLTRGRAAMAEELDRIEGCPEAVAALDVPRLRAVLADWPSDGWERHDVVLRYRYLLPRAIAMGHFLRRATRSNA